MRVRFTMKKLPFYLILFTLFGTLSSTSFSWINRPIYFLLNGAKSYVHAESSGAFLYVFDVPGPQTTLTEEGKLYFGSKCMRLLPNTNILVITDLFDCGVFEVSSHFMTLNDAFVCPNAERKLGIQEDECSSSFHFVPGHWTNRRVYFNVENDVKCFAVKASPDIKCSIDGESDVTTLTESGTLYFGTSCVGIGGGGKLQLQDDRECATFRIKNEKLRESSNYVCLIGGSRKLKSTSSECNFKFNVEVQANSPSTSTIITPSPTSHVKLEELESTQHLSTTPVMVAMVSTESKNTADVSYIRSVKGRSVEESYHHSAKHKSTVSRNQSHSLVVTLEINSQTGERRNTVKITLSPTLELSPSQIEKLKTVSQTSLSSSSIISQEVSYYGTPSRWVEEECPKNCKLSATFRHRRCENLQRHHSSSNTNTTTNRSTTLTAERCVANEREEIKCLNLTNCNGTRYYLAHAGWSCQRFCKERGLECNPAIETGNSADIFDDVILNYTRDLSKAIWHHDFGPYCGTSSGKCAEYLHIPADVECDAAPPERYQRLCYCEEKVDVGFGSWSPWSSCTSTCNGTRIRSRECFDYCHGDYMERERCGATLCPVHGRLSQWTGWSSCSASCSGGERIKSRKCDHPTPSNGGKSCVGNLEITEQCNVHNCAVDAEWSEWTAWSACQKPCNNGSFMRQRFCSQALYDGNTTCHGESIQKKPCNEQPCPETTANLTLPLDQTFSAEYLNKSSEAFQALEQTLLVQFNETFSINEGETSSIIGFTLNSARKGSVIVDITLLFGSFDSYQFVSVQDSIDVEGSIGKLPIASNGTTYFTLDDKVPSAPPVNISITSPAPTTLSVSWSPVQLQMYGQNATSKVITGYIVFYREKVMTSYPYNTMSSVNTTLEIAGLHPGTTYHMRLLAYTQAGNGVSSILLKHTTKETRPNMAPSSISATSYKAFSVFLEWDGIPRRAMNGAPLGYKVYTYWNDSLIDISQTEYGQQSVVVAGLHPSTVYIFQVCAYNSIGDGPCDKTMGKTQPSPPTSPPLNVTVDETKTHNQLTIYWVQPAKKTMHGDLIAYRISVMDLNGTALRKTVSVHPGFNSFVLTDLTPNTRYRIEVLAVNEYGDGPPANVDGETCKCPEIATTSYFIQAPYLYHDKKQNNRIDGLFAEVLTEMVPFICGSCKRPNGVLNSTLDMSRNGRNDVAERNTELRAIQAIDEYTALTFPVVGTKYLDHFLKYPYVPLVEHPGVVLIAKDKDVNEVVISMITMVFNVWPILFLNLLIMIIAGFIIWIWEGGMHEEADFSKKIFRGLAQGWYWAYITIGTHGYGDFTPRYRLSRIFAVMFMLIGLVMTSLIIGSIVTAVTTVNDAARVKIYGAEIGAITGSFEERVGLMRNGKLNTKRKFQKISELKDALLRGDIQGVLLDAYTAGSNRNAFHHPQLRALSMIKYPRTYGVVLSGALAHVSNEARDYVQTNQQRILEILQRSTEAMEPTEKEAMKLPYEADSKIFQATIIILSCTLFAIVFVGFLYERIFAGRKSRKIANSHDKEKELMKEVNEVVKTFHQSFTNSLERLTLQHADSLIKLNNSLRKRRSSTAAKTQKKKNNLNY